MRLQFILALVLSCVAVSLGQQSPAVPPAPDAPSAPAQPAAPADDISGMYTFLREGEFVQVNVEDGGQITGFVSRYGETDTDKETFLDQFFSRGQLKGHALEFATKPVHGVWFEFAGLVSRGPGKSLRDEGYRVIKGKLVRHKPGKDDRDVTESREIEMKSFPADEEEDPEK